MHRHDDVTRLIGMKQLHKHADIAMPTDTLDILLRRFSVSANLFYAGPLYGMTDAHVVEGKGNLHVIQRGLAEVRTENHPGLLIVEPTVLLYPRPLAHRFHTDEQSGADFVCAKVDFAAGRMNPIVQALPPVLAVPLAKMPEMRTTIDLLFAEAFGQRHGRQTTLDRLFEVVLIHLLRKVIDEGMMSTGVLAGLAHPQLAKAMVALHASPAHPWTLDSLASIAGMSRSRFAVTFKATLGSTTGDYLCGCRLALAQALLRRDTPIKHVAAEVGYGSPVALTRVFKAHLGMSPRAWMQSEHLASRARSHSTDSFPGSCAQEGAV